jgi:hypothetical protein
MANKITEVYAYQARVDTSTNVGGVAYEQEAADENLPSLNGISIRQYDPDKSIQYKGVVDTPSFKTLYDGDCFKAGYTYTGYEPDYFLGMVFVQVDEQIGAGTLDVATVHPNLTLIHAYLREKGDSVMIPYAYVSANLVSVRHTAYIPDTNEFTITATLIQL